MLSKIFILKMQILKNNLKTLFYKYPIVLFLSAFLFVVIIGAIGYSINYFITNINLVVSGGEILQRNINRAIIRMYNIVLVVIAIFIILQQYSIKQRIIPEILLINEYGISETVNSFNRVESFINVIFVTVCTFPIFLKILSLYRLNTAFIALILLGMYSYLLAFVYVIRLVISLTKYILIYKFNLVSPGMIEELILAILLGIMSIAGFLCYQTNLGKLLPSYNIIDWIGTYLEGNAVYAYMKTLLHICLGILTFLICKYIVTIFERDYSYDIHKKVKSKLKFNSKYVDHYLILVYKIFKSNIQNMFGIGLILVSSIFGIKVLELSEAFYTYVPILYYVMIILVVLGISVFICDFDDYDVYDVLKNYNGNAIKYNLLLYLAEVIFFTVVFLVYLLVFYKVLSMPYDSLIHTPIVSIPLICSIALFVKKVLLEKQSSVSMKTCASLATASIYFGSRILVRHIIGSKVGEKVGEGIYLGWLFIGMVLFYIIQLILVKREWGIDAK